MVRCPRGQEAVCNTEYTGSNPVRTSKQIHGIKDITFDFDSNNLGSIPSGSTINLLKMAGKTKTRLVMEEFKKGQLNIGKSPKKVTSRKQAIAIALSEQKRVNSKKK